MVRGLYTAATGMLVENMRTDVIANNLANCNTTGYKRDIGVFKALPEKMIRRAHDQAIPPLPVAKTVKPIHPERELSNLPFRRPPIIGKLGTGAILDEVWVDHEEGLMQETGRNLDVASVRQSFFLVEDPAGGVFLTKNGSFNIDSEGYLVTQSGEYVLGTNSTDPKTLPAVLLDEKGDPTIGLSRIYGGRQGEFHLSEEGQVFPGDRESSQSLVRAFLEDPRQLRKVGSNFYRHDHGTLAPDTKTPLAIGYVEKANFSIVTEMVEMITASRAYENNARVIQTHDSLLDRAVNTLGRVGG